MLCASNSSFAHNNASSYSKENFWHQICFFLCACKIRVDLSDCGGNYFILRITFHICAIFYYKFCSIFLRIMLTFYDNVFFYFEIVCMRWQKQFLNIKKIHFSSKKDCLPLEQIRKRNWSVINHRQEASSQVVVSAFGTKRKVLKSKEIYRGNRILVWRDVLAFEQINADFKNICRWINKLLRKVQVINSLGRSETEGIHMIDLIFFSNNKGNKDN